MNNQIFHPKYTIIRAISSRTVPATYLARNLSTGSRVIIKSFRFGLAESQWQSFNQIENEIKILKRLNHAQIPKYLDSFQEESSFYLVQEFIKGETLSTQKVYLEEEVIAITKQVLSILIYLSSQNTPVVHHDLKPENLLIDKDHKIYLIDFGISKEIKGETIGLTTLSGTEGFIAPEKMLGRKSDLRSDLYSLGITLSCLLTKTPTSRAVSLLNDDFELRSGTLNCSQEFDEWIQKLVKRKPEDRFQNAAVALSRLQQISNFPPVEQVKKKSLKYQDKKRAIEINETEYITEKFIVLTIRFIASLPLFLIPPFLSFKLCLALSYDATGCSISFSQLIAQGIIGYLPWTNIGNLFSLAINKAYDLASYGFSFLMTALSMLRIMSSIISGDLYRLKNIFLRFSLAWYVLFLLFVFKTYLIGYDPVSWLVR